MSHKNNTHKNLIAFILSSIAVLLLFINISQAGPGKAQFTTNFKLKDLGGRELALKDFRGKIVVLIFGELYQQNTLKALQDLKRVLNEKASYREEIDVFLIISEKRNADEYLKVKGGLEINYPVLLDYQRNAYAQFEIVAIPTTFVIDRQGKIAAKLASYTIAYYDQIDAELGYLLGELNEQELKSVMSPTAEPEISGKTDRILSLAKSLKKRGYYDNALESYKQVLAGDPDLKEAHIAVGSIYIKKKDPENAQREFQAVLDKNPDEPVALKGMAQVHFLKGEVKKAEDLLQKVILSDYEDDDIYYIMGEIYEKQGKLKEAISFYKKNCLKLLQKRANN
jgi:tetratricopeptide (TPR) repeat protein